MYTRKSIETHKGRLIELSFVDKEGRFHKSVGKIYETGDLVMIFEINKDDHYISMPYKNILDINKPEKVV